MRKSALIGVSLLTFACGSDRSATEGVLADFETVIFSSAGVTVEYTIGASEGTPDGGEGGPPGGGEGEPPGGGEEGPPGGGEGEPPGGGEGGPPGGGVVESNIVPLLNAEVRQIPQLQELRACLGDTNENGVCDPGEAGCMTCRDVPAGTPCNGGGFRSVCCAGGDACFGEPIEFTITFNFRSIPSPNVSNRSRSMPTSPVIIQGYTATFNYSSGCPTELSLIESEALSVYVPAPSKDGESTAQVKITHSTQPWLVSEGISNVCMTAPRINFRIPTTFTSSFCKVDGFYNFTVMEQYTGKRKTITVPVSVKFIPSTGECTP